MVLSIRKVVFCSSILALGWTTIYGRPIRPESQCTGFIHPLVSRPAEQQQELLLSRRSLGRVHLFGKGKAPEPPKQKSLIENLFGKKQVKVDKPTRKKLKVGLVGVAFRIIHD